jgi:hypothetical protein
MLRKWRTKTDIEATLQTLREVVQVTRDVTVDWNSIETTSSSFLFELDTTTTSRTVSEDDINRLSEAFDNKWQLLGPRLGVSSQIVSACESDHPHDTCKQITMMLTHWQTKSQADATFDQLIPVLLASPMFDIDVDTVKNIVEQM